MRSLARSVPLAALTILAACALIIPACADGSNEQPPSGTAGATQDSGDGATSDGNNHDVSTTPDAKDASPDAHDVSSEVQSENDSSVDAPAEGQTEAQTEAQAEDAPPMDTSTDAVLADALADAAMANTCLGDPPSGGPDPLPWPVYAGTCPTFVPAPANNSLVSSGANREFKIALPASMSATEKLPVVFVWHWLGGSAEDAYSALELQAAVDKHRFIAVIPNNKGDLLLKWPFSILDSQGRVDEEFQFFDDMLGCVALAYPNVLRHCVSSLGVSAGALFTDQLAAARANRLASFVSVSGGVGTTARPWGKPARKLPGIVLWGGPNDDYQGLYDFNKGSLDLEDALVGQGNFFVECVHNCGHAVPPFEAPSGGTRYDVFWSFVFDHPFWLAPGSSTYKGGLPAVFPSWCGVGKGGAVPRADGSPC
jgi:hypothetical protein